MTIENKVAKLERYAALEGAEVGELCQLLCRLMTYVDYMDENFNSALRKEINKQLKNFTQHSRIVEKAKTTEEQVIELEWMF